MHKRKTDPRQLIIPPPATVHITYRRDQFTYKVGDGTDPNAKIGGYVITHDATVREGWVRRLRKIGFTYFFGYCDAHGKHSVMFSR